MTTNQDIPIGGALQFHKNTMAECVALLKANVRPEGFPKKEWDEHINSMIQMHEDQNLNVSEVFEYDVTHLPLSERTTSRGTVIDTYHATIPRTEDEVKSDLLQF